MRSRRPWLFGAPLLPVLARLCGLPPRALPVLNTFAAILTAMEVLYVLASHVLVPFQLAAAACREVVRVSGAGGAVGQGGGLRGGGLQGGGSRAEPGLLRAQLQGSGPPAPSSPPTCGAGWGAAPLSVPSPQALEMYRLVALGVSLWSQLAVPLLFLVFWLVLFSLRLSSFLTSSGSPLAQQGLLFLLLSR